MKSQIVVHFQVVLRIWRDAGTKVEDHRVRAPADWVRVLCAQAPREFVQHARNPDRSVTIGGRNQVFAPIYGAPLCRDLEGWVVQPPYSVPLICDFSNKVSGTGGRMFNA